MCLAVIGAVLLPALLAANFSKSEDKRMTNFIVFLLLLVLFSVVPAIFTNINNHEKYLWLFIWNPLIFIPMMQESAFMKNQLLTAILIVDSVILILLWVTAFIAFRGYREVFAEAERGLVKENTPATGT
jgi:ABC-type polysaccharide/polyol phosphate export permease